MRKLLIILTVLAALVPMARAKDPYFPLPDPTNITDFQERTDYIIEHYWDRCPWNNAFSSRQGMADAFSVYIELIPLASREVSLASIDNLIKTLKKYPEGLAFIIERAEYELLGDSAQYTSDEVLIPFLGAGKDHKKIDKERRERYARLYSQLSNSPLGGRAPDARLILPDGTTKSLHSITEADTTSVTILYIYDPADPGYRLDRTRLSADSRLNALIDAGIVRMVAVYPNAPDDTWRADAASAPAGWTVAAVADGQMIFDLKRMPTVYTISVDGRIISKHDTPASILDKLYTL